MNDFWKKAEKLWQDLLIVTGCAAVAGEGYLLLETAFGWDTDPTLGVWCINNLLLLLLIVVGWVYDEIRKLMQD